VDAVLFVAEGDWKTAWEIFTEPPRELIQGVIDKINELLGLETALKNFMNEHVFPHSFDFGGGGQGPGGGGRGGFGDIDPSFFGGGFPFGGFGNLTVAPVMPAGFSSSESKVNSDNTVINIEQHIAPNGDFGGARQGAQSGIREALLGRKLT
jgi:hypothetical protein